MTAPSVADLARVAVKLLDDYAVARETALRLAARSEPAPASLGEALALHTLIARALHALDDALDDAAEPGSTTGVWWARAHCAAAGVIDADVWASELYALAAAVPDGERATPPPVEAPRG